MTSLKFPHRRQFLHLAAGAAALPVSPRIARAQAYPSRPVRVIVPFAPGGVTDTFGRLIAQKLGDQLGARFFVENITGASGNIGTAQAAKAPPDGYTLLNAFSSLVVNPTLFQRVAYDVHKDFAPVTLAVASTTTLVINPSVAARTVSELVALIAPTPKSTTMVRLERGRKIISRANSSASRAASIWFTSPSPAGHLRWPRFSASTRRSALCRHRRPWSMCVPVRCARLP